MKAKNRILYDINISFIGDCKEVDEDFRKLYNQKMEKNVRKNGEKE